MYGRTELRYPRQEPPHPDDQLARTEWLLDKIVRPEGEPFNDVLLPRPGCKDDHRKSAKRGPGTECYQELFPGHDWHHQIEDNEINGFAREKCKGFCAIGYTLDSIPAVLELVFDEGPCGGFILNDEHAVRLRPAGCVFL